ncbi:DUF6053 domain-containing protein [Lysobacter yananisis]|uniref:DUF6053 domain-containing protein n=1 Tax=Lysobacter yananisis TaxID=1003114 RepID=UPI003CE4A7A1
MRTTGLLRKAVVGGPSGPTPCAQVAVIGHKGIGAEAPPTKAAPIKADRRDKRGDWAAGAGRAEPSRPAS